MPFSAGVFSRLYNWASDRNNGIKLQASRMDSEFDGIASGLSMAILKDGTQVVTADIPFNNKKITGLADPTAQSHALTLGYAGTGAVDWYGNAGGSANSIVLLSNAASPNSLVNGLSVRFRVTAENTGAVTLTFPAQGTKAFKKNGRFDFNAGDLKVGDIVAATYSSSLDEWIAYSTIISSYDIVPSGAVAFFGMSSAPNGWLKANGAAISRTTFATLFAAIGTVYGSGNGSTTFNLPDLRGEFLRGWDDGRGVDSGRGIGSNQAHQFQSHGHIYEFANVVQVPGGAGLVLDSIASNTLNASVANRVSTPLDIGSGLSTGSETRPRNVALLACIKY